MEGNSYWMTQKLRQCEVLINTTSVRDIDALNKYCAEFLEFANYLQKHFSCNQMHSERNKQHAELIFVCLNQTIVCIRHLERTFKAEETSGATHKASRNYFCGRMEWCLKRLYAELQAAAPNKPFAKNHSFLELMDFALNSLSAISNDENDSINNTVKNQSLGQSIRCTVDALLSHTLAFANVAVSHQDKKALSSLCQKVLRDCVAFQAECERDSPNGKLKAMTLKQAICQLEDYINEALLRLLYKCFLDFDKISVDKLHIAVKNAAADDQAADEIIADFDVNIDRAMEIGTFAIAFTPNLKVKALVSSCLASFESLDETLVPALQSIGSELYAELLKDHFNEEVIKFKSALQEIIDTRAFIGCYLELLTTTIDSSEKKFDVVHLQNLVQMGGFLYEHFQLPVNREHFLKSHLDYVTQFIDMLYECQAILMCASQVERERILKRFKILRKILRKLYDSMDQNPKSGKDDPESCAPLIDDKFDMLETLGIKPSTRSFLYDTMRERRHSNIYKAARANQNVGNNLQEKCKKNNICGTMRRHESLRTVMFKRQNMAQTQNLYNTISSQSVSLQISDILDELNNFTSSFSSNAQTLKN